MRSCQLPPARLACGGEQAEQRMHRARAGRIHAVELERVGQARGQAAVGDKGRQRRPAPGNPPRRARQAEPQAGEVGLVGARIFGLDREVERAFGTQQCGVGGFVRLVADVAQTEQPGAQQVGADALEAAPQGGIEAVLEFARAQRIGQQQRQAQRGVACGHERDLRPVRRLRGEHAQDRRRAVGQGLELEGAEIGGEHAMDGWKKGRRILARRPFPLP
jgi:hypothetical protein